MARSEDGAGPTHPDADAPAREQARHRARPEHVFGTRALRAWNYMFCRVYHRLTIFAPPRLPTHGPAIVVCNHVSGLDPLLIQSACPRRVIHWMMAREYYDIAAIRWVFETMQAIPVDRSGRDLAATRAALRVLDEGKVLGVFPEGRIETARELLPFQTGVAMMAAKTGVPVHPAYLDGTQRGREMLAAFISSCRAGIRFGDPLTLARGDSARNRLDGATAIIQSAVERLRPTSEADVVLWKRAPGENLKKLGVREFGWRIMLGAVDGFGDGRLRESRYI